MLYLPFPQKRVGLKDTLEGIGLPSTPIVMMSLSNHNQTCLSPPLTGLVNERAGRTDKQVKS